LIHILNSEDQDVEVRQIAGLSLKGMMERSFVNLTEDAIEYFKVNILKCYLHNNPIIKKTISNLINTFLRHGGMEMWPEILYFLMDNLNSNSGVEISLETLNIIIEDSGSYLEENYSNFLMELLPKLTNYLKDMGDKTIEKNDHLIILVLSTLNIMLESCSMFMNENLEEVAKVLLNLLDTQNMDMRYKLGGCWLSMVRMRKEVLLELINSLFQFFTENLTVEQYQMNFITSEFFLLILEEHEELMNDEKVKEHFKQNLEK
jgi:hypothetical protein